MPLVTSSSIQGNLFRQASSPTSAQTGDVWVDTDTGEIFTYNGTTWKQKSTSLGKLVFFGSGST